MKRLDAALFETGLLAGARRRVLVALLPLAVLWLAVLWAAMGVRPASDPARTTAAAAAPVLQVAARSGEAAPGGGMLDRFDVGGQAIPAPANRQGEIALFVALVRSKAAEALLLASGGKLAKIAAIGDAVPSGEHIAGFSERPGVALNDEGRAAFVATLTGGRATSGIFTARAGKIEAVALSGADAPEISGGTLAAFEAPFLNKAGDVVFLASVRRGREALDGIFLFHQGRLRKLVAVGDEAPGGGEFAGFGLPALNDQGAVAFAAVIERGANIGGIYLIQDGATRLVLASGAAAPSGGIFARFSEHLELNNAGAIAFSAVLRQGGPGSGIFVLDGEIARAVALAGDTAPGGGTFAAFASWPGLSDNGAAAFIASIDGSSSALGVYRADSEGVTRIAAIGDTLASGGRIASLPLYPALAISAQGAVTFAAAVERDGAPQETLFYYGPPRAAR